MKQKFANLESNSNRTWNRIRTNPFVRSGSISNSSNLICALSGPSAMRHGICLCFLITHGPETLLAEDLGEFLWCPRHIIRRQGGPGRVFPSCHLGTEWEF